MRATVNRISEPIVRHGFEAMLQCRPLGKEAINSVRVGIGSFIDESGYQSATEAGFICRGAHTAAFKKRTRLAY